MAEERGVTKRFAKVCPCESCKKVRGERHKIAYGTIHSYTSQPDEGWKPQMTLAERRAVQAGAPKPWYMGVELETQLPEHQMRPMPVMPQIPSEPLGVSYYDPAWSVYEAAIQRVYSERDRIRAEWDYTQPVLVTGEEVVSMARPRHFWHPKHDGSVTGPEFASRPASLAWWYSRRQSLEYMMMTMLHSGVRSHSGDKCGMHVNISMTAFENAAHLARFARLINANKSWSKTMSQRTEVSVNQWARIGGSGFRRIDDIEQWAAEIIRYGSADLDRYNALNTPGGGRIEFRLPRGTLRIDRFYKNLEWVHSMVEYTRAFGDTSSASYMRWVMGRNEYADLQAFLTERFRVEHTAPYTPIIAETPVDHRMASAPSGSVLGEWREPSESDRRSRRGACPCGDGCRDGNCGACDDNEFESEFEPDRCSCGDGCEAGYCRACGDILPGAENIEPPFHEGPQLSASSARFALPGCQCGICDPRSVRPLQHQLQWIPANFLNATALNNSNVAGAFVSNGDLISGMTPAESE